MICSVLRSTGRGRESRPSSQTNQIPEIRYDVVGPICETGDFLGKDRPLVTEPGHHLAILDAGAYGFGMGSNYNTRPRGCEVLIEEGTARVIRRRESLDDLLAHELDGLKSS